MVPESESMLEANKIIRTWKGWTTKENAPVYENMLINEIFPAVKKSGVAGLEKVSISIKQNPEDVEFLLILQFDCLESVKTFAGENFQMAYIPDAARGVLLRYEETAEHYRLRKELIL